MALAGVDPRECSALMAPAVSLVVTLLNEVASVDRLLESVTAQTTPPAEIVVVDGGSTDGTWERLQDWTARLPLKPVLAPGLNIAAGRNLAFQAASYDLVAVTDAGVRLDPRWLERLLAALGPDADVVAGFFRPDAHGPFEVAMGATVLPDQSDVSAASFLPSSRSLLVRRDAWQRVGGYPEWLDYCEDLVFDLALKRQGCRFAFAPDATVWLRPRSSFAAFFRQYFLYARGDGKADLWRRRHAIRYTTYVAAPLLLGLAGRRWWARALVALGAAVYARRPYQRLAPSLASLGLAEVFQAILLVPAIRLAGDVAKMLGYPAGVRWRLSQRGKDVTVSR